MSRFLAGLRDTFQMILTDRAAMITLIGAALLYSFFYPAAYSSQVASQLPVAIVDLDRSSLSRSLVRKMLSVRAVHPVASVTSLSEAKVMLGREDALGILLIDANFQRDILRGRQGHVSIFGNGAFLSAAGSALTGLGDAASSFGRDAGLTRARFAGAASPPPVQLVQRPLFNTREGYGSTVVPGVAILIVQQTLLLGIGLLMGTLQERGARIASSVPGLAGAAVALGVIGMTNLLYYAGFVFWFQDYPRGGHFLGLIATAPLFIAAVVACGLFVGSFFRLRERPLQFLGLLSLPLFFMSHLSWPETASPLALAWLAQLLPTTPGINAMIKFNQMGARFSETMPELWNLALLVLLYGALAAWRWGRLEAAPGPCAGRKW